MRAANARLLWASTTKKPSLLADLPLVSEIVDSEKKISALLPVLQGMMRGGMVTREKARVLYYHSDQTTAPWGAGPAGS